MKKKFLKSNRKVLKSVKDNLSKVDGIKKMKYSTQVMVEKLLGIFFNREKSFNSVESNARLSGANQTVSNTLAYFLKKRKTKTSK